MAGFLDWGTEDLLKIFDRIKMKSKGQFVSSSTFLMTLRETDTRDCPLPATRAPCIRTFTPLASRK
jgi:hypothetical protein